MKFSFAASLAIVLLTISILVGCTTTQQTTEYKTVAAAEASVSGAYSAYLDLVVTGKITTNSVPRVSKAFNAFQATANGVVVTRGLFATNAPPPDLVQAAADAIAIINSAK